MPSSGNRRFLLLLLLCGCRAQPAPPPPTSQPASTTTTAATTAAAGPALLPEAGAWDAARCAAGLAEERECRSAIARLLELHAPLGQHLWRTPAGTAPVGLAARRVSETVWAIGLPVAGCENHLRGVLLLNGEGVPWRYGDEAEMAASLLVISADADVLPHLLLAPRRIWIVTERPQLAITRATPAEGLVFAPGRKARFTYVALILPELDGAELAQYRWDPWESMFFGPAERTLPDPPGGELLIDLGKSPLLEPRGGEIAPPDPLTPPEPPPGVEKCEPA